MRALEKEAPEKQQAQQKSQSVNDNFDKTHKIFYPCFNESLKRLRPNFHFSSGFYLMSKPRRTFLFFSLASILILSAFRLSPAQTVETTIRIESAVAVVEGRLTQAGAAPETRNFSFLSSYAGAENLGARVSELELSGPDGQKIAYRKLAPGEFLAESAYRAWRYKIDLRPPDSPAALAHVSWLGPERGILTTADLLPQLGAAATAKIALALPPGWRAATVEKDAGNGAFAVDDLEKAVFYVGRGWRERESPSAGPRLLISGEWKFSDDEAAQMTGAIVADYEQLFGGRSPAEALVYLGRYPEGAAFGRWEAETRGASVTIFSADMPFPTQSAQKLHEQLRHELFHLWIPNGVNLAGNYDWFYEGFALYQSLRTAVALNRIRFDDFLDTLGRAYDLDAGLKSRRASLLEASRRRWNGAETQVYARGLLVAFLADLAMLQKSKGKNSLNEVLREIYRKHRPPAAREDGNAAILKILRARPELVPIVEKYVSGTEDIAWQTELAAAGIETATANFSTKLTVTAKPAGRQKDLLDKLGYNNWRKRSELPK
jgi:hypothetical protein